MKNRYESVKKILSIKKRRCEKAEKKRQKINKKLVNKKKEVVTLDQQLEQHKIFTKKHTSKLWSELVGKNISIREIDAVRRNVDQLKEKEVFIKQEIDEEKNNVKKIKFELEEARKEYVKKVLEKEKFKKICDKFKQEWIENLQKQQDRAEFD